MKPDMKGRAVQTLLLIGVSLAPVVMLMTLRAGQAGGRRPLHAAGAAASPAGYPPDLLAQTSGRITLAGLARPVEVIRDRWGVPHIYAESAADLFFAQGFVVAQDRLWQMEMWRRTGEGRLAEVLGEAALARDIHARRVRYRGNMEAEWAGYAPDARRVITSFVAGVNAFIEQATAAGRLPVEFAMMGFRPDPWTPEVCLTRVAGYIMSRNLPSEVLLAELVHRMGPERAMEFFRADPPTKIRAEPGVDFAAITAVAGPLLAGHRTASAPLIPRDSDIGSNNWTISGSRTASGRPILANDPHRPLLLPSLRYTSHLVAPGWNVIGAGEPALPGIAVGHNERIAYGFTIFAADQMDLYVEQTDPGNPRRYRHRGAWEQMRAVEEQFRVKGKPEPVTVELLFTRHGPVIFEDRERRLAYALRWVGSEPGAAGYLASLSVSRARNWSEFLKALERWKSPPLNVVYADVDGNIGYQAAGLAPVRRRWSGLAPVPGDSGLYEWAGFRRLDELPRAFNPASGFVATANHKTIRAGGVPPVGYEWTAPYRFRRIEQVLSARRDFTLADLERLQHDETSLPAEQLVGMLVGPETTLEGKDARLRAAIDKDARLRAAIELLRGWDRVLAPGSAAAALYEVWVQKVPARVLRPMVPAEAWPAYASRASLPIALSFLERRGADPRGARREAFLDTLLDTLREAQAELSAKLGPDMKKWRWGDLHKAEFRHPLSPEFSLAPVERGGDGWTVNNTSYSASTYRQVSGASYRQILDVGEWDNSVAINVPGQSGQPGSPHYQDLLPLWAAGRYHPLPYSRAAVEKHAASRLVLDPRPRTIPAAAQR